MIAESGTLSIGKLARAAGVSADALRYYEREGLLVPAQRTATGYRLYFADSALRRLRFIRQAQQCGFSLAEIRELLALRVRSGSSCSDVRNTALAKKRELDNRIEALRALSRALDRLVGACDDDTRSLDACPILCALETMLEVADGERPFSPRHIHRSHVLVGA